MGSNGYTFLMESPQIGCFVEGQNKIIVRREAAKRLMAY
jgi:hypothetical protein